ncbi:hypothetical protein ACUCJX_000199 [Yersinia enterocolitica]
MANAFDFELVTNDQVMPINWIRRQKMLACQLIILAGSAAQCRF